MIGVGSKYINNILDNFKIIKLRGIERTSPNLNYLVLNRFS